MMLIEHGLDLLFHKIEIFFWHIILGNPLLNFKWKYLTDRLRQAHRLIVRWHWWYYNIASSLLLSSLSSSLILLDVRWFITFKQGFDYIVDILHADIC